MVLMTDIFDLKITEITRQHRIYSMKDME
jgi:hypothetical protein